MFEYSLKAGLYKMQKESQLLTLCHEFVTFGNKGYVHIQIFIYTLNRFQETLQFEHFCPIYIYLFFPHQKGNEQCDGQCLYVILTAAIVLSF